ncbi:hypothetical protein [Sphingobium baderi]|uniref:Uncharacterized protein n=1 Tax=Sphingobium baderi LL03 TaxID=1114964 RepID=T0FZP0_9SPHN|nr:hypothetical protein [Sphingobium baderi]EQA96825.1 hypothetical protein L485_22345 [Sphingobium baderi LL03]KMS63941.1 hypothetical protein V475_23185 [Sphingobium baderi LL03]
MAQGAIQIDEKRLAQVMERGLSSGGHFSFEDGVCAMEAAAYIAGEPHSDHPDCACPVITAFMISWNDSLNDEDRNRLILPLIVKTVGTRSTPEVEQRRAIMATDWLIRVHTPAWLRLAGLKGQADTLANLPEITGVEGFAPIRAPLEAIRKDAAAAGAAAGAAARDAARAAAGAAAGAAARDAARAAARAAAWDAAWAAARDAAWDAARAAAGAAARDAAWDAAGDAAWDAARAAARAAAGAALKPTVTELQASASDLIVRMCAVGA